MDQEKRESWMAFRCVKCGYEYVERIELPMRIASFLDRLDAWGKRCPGCGHCPRKKDRDGIIILTGEDHDRVVAKKAGQA